MAMKMARRAACAVTMLVLAGGLSSCIDDVTPPQREGVAAQTNAIRLYLDNELVMTIFQDGQITLGPIVFLRTTPTNAATERPIRAELLDQSGNVINASPDDVRINIGTGSTATASFIREGAFTGRLRSTTTNLPATTDLVVGLYDMHQRRVAVGPYTVRITARLP